MKTRALPQAARCATLRASSALILLASLAALSSCELFKDLLGIKDEAPPTGSGAMTLLSVTRSSAELRWEEATDDETEAATISYALLRAENPDGFDIDYDGDDWALSWAEGALFKRVDLPLDDHDYWFAALARDEAGNRFLYSPIKAHSLVHHGRLDPSFGAEGQVYLRRVENRSYSAFHALPLSDGSTLVLGGDAPYWELARILPDGSADRGFAPDACGLRQYPHPDAPNTLSYSVTDGIILPLEDGSYLLAGTWWGNYAYQPNPDFSYFVPDRRILLLKLNADGSIDTSWGDAGYAIIQAAFGNTLKGAAILNGKLYLAGLGYTWEDKRPADSDPQAPDADAWLYGADWGLARVDLGTGTLDESFGSSGLVVTGLRTEALGVQDGKLLVCGREWEGERNLLGRYNADGSLDASFGTAGWVDISTPGGSLGFQPAAIALGEGASIFLAGTLTVPNLDPSNPNDMRAPGLVKLSPEGVIDSTFAQEGAWHHPAWGDATALALHPDGRLMLSGQLGFRDTSSYGDTSQPYQIFAVALDQDSGAAFTTGPEEWDERGVAYPRIGWVNYESIDPNMARGMAIRADGSILIYGMRRFLSEYYQCGSMALVLLKP